MSNALVYDGALRCANDVIAASRLTVNTDDKLKVS